MVVIPYRGALEHSEIEEGFYALSLAITVIGSKNHEVLYHYFHKDIAESTAIALQSVEVDTEFNRLSKFPLFSIKTMVGQPSSHTIAHDEEQLYLYEFRVKNSPPSMLLSGYVLNSSYGLCDDYDLCRVDYVDVQVDISKSKKDYTPIELILTRFSTIRVPSLKEMLRVESKEKREHTKLLFKEGKYVEERLKSSRELSIAEVEKGAKNGTNYSKFLLANLLYENYSQEAKTLTELNGIAYYLQKNGHNKEAVMLLESLLKNYPNRMVAYYNLADAYWALGRKKEAKKMYEIYVKQMKARGKGKRIPKLVRERLKSELSVKKTDVKYSKRRVYFTGQLATEKYFDKSRKRAGVWKKYYYTREKDYKNGETKPILQWERTYKDDKLIAVKDYYKNGKISKIRYFKEAIPDGEWKIYDKNSNVTVEKWVNGVLEGKDSSLPQNVYLIKNNSEGKIKENYYDGSLHEEVTYMNAKMNGLYKSYHESGFIGTIGYFNNNKKVGSWKKYADGSGNLLMVTNYKNDIKDGEQISYSHKKIGWVRIYDNEARIERRDYYSNGNLHFVRKYKIYGAETGKWQVCAGNGKMFVLENYKNGKKNGLSEVYYTSYRSDMLSSQFGGIKSKIVNDDMYNCIENDRIKERGYYLNGKRDGEWKEYLKNGELSKVTLYRNGKLIK